MIPARKRPRLAQLGSLQPIPIRSALGLNQTTLTELRMMSIALHRRTLRVC
ncbi:hypothetical protein ALT721_2150023 [Alteromonas alvinellae]|jgi:hypothetical protein